MLTALLLAAAAPDAPPLAPVTKWDIEYAKDMCILSRGYRKGDKDVTLAFRPSPMSLWTEIVLGLSEPTPVVLKGKAGITLLPSTTGAKGSFIRYAPGKSDRSLVRLTLEQKALSGLGNAEAIGIRLSPGRTYNFALPAMKAAMRALATCQADLLKGWGIDSAERDAVATLPEPNLAGGVFGSDAYPRDAVANRQQGRSTAVVLVTEQGAAATCTIVSKSGSASLDQTTCAILRRVRYEPGRDRDGRPVTAHLVVPVNWVLPQ